jgi:hypothetical protein
MIRLIAVALLVLGMAVPNSANEPQGRTPQAPKPAAPQPGQPGQSAPPAAAPSAPAPPPDLRKRTPPKDLNVHVELTIADQLGTGAPEKKVVSLLAADQTMGQVRASARANRPNIGFVGAGLNVDARPFVLENDRVLVELKLEYMPFLPNAGPNAPAQEPTNLNESISVILQSGKPLTISQAVDPISDRRMTVEVKATIVR